jgi:hypothetical protein
VCVCIYFVHTNDSAEYEVVVHSSTEYIQHVPRVPREPRVPRYNFVPSLSRFGPWVRAEALRTHSLTRATSFMYSVLSNLA